MDERALHLHLVFVPLTEDDRLSAKDIIDDLAGCRKCQDEFFERVANIFPELVRGNKIELTGRQYFSVKGLKATTKDHISELFHLRNEVNTSRKYFKQIPPALKIEIDKQIAETKKQQKNKNWER